MGLDQNGQPLGSGGNSGGPVTADFQSIQSNVFTPICSKCHIGAGAPEGLQLDAAHSYNLLVGVPSVEQPNLLRVKPSDPANSYMLHKIEGAPGIVGGQMPLGETPLPQATIAAISQWITNGAPNAPAAAASSFEVQGTVPLDHEMVSSPPPRIVVTFTQEVDASLVNESTITVERMPNPRLDPESPMASGSARSVAVTRALAGLNPSVLLITPSAPLAPGTYRVTVRGSGGGAVANLNATTLGSDESFEFTVEPAR
jgi:Bacterial Ig-like domain